MSLNRYEDKDMMLCITTQAFYQSHFFSSSIKCVGNKFEFLPNQKYSQHF
jgi:hypothetical protein